MYLEKRTMNKSTVLDCYGKFEEQDNDQFMKTIECLQSEGCQHLVLNLSSVYRVDKNILNLLTFAFDFYVSSGAQLTLVTPQSSGRGDLEKANIHKIIPTYLSVYDALHRQKAVVDKTPFTKANDTIQEFAGLPLLKKGDTESLGEGTDHPSEFAGAGVGGEQPPEKRRSAD